MGEVGGLASDLSLEFGVRLNLSPRESCVAQVRSVCPFVPILSRHTEQGKREAGQEMRAKPGKAGGYCQSATLFEMERNMDDKNALEMINALIAAGHSGRLDDVKKKLEQKKRVAWRPGLGEKYFFIGGDGLVRLSLNHGCSIDKFRIRTGNYYRTEKDAEMALKIINRIIELRGDWTPDWEDGGQEKYALYYQHPPKKWDRISNLKEERLGTIYLPSADAAKTLIDEFGDDLLLVSGRI